MANGLPTGARSPWAPVDAHAADSWLGAVQAQDFEMTLWSLTRPCTAARDDILAAYDESRLVRLNCGKVLHDEGSAQ